MILKTHAHARAGLVGNPSDGYHGKTIALIVRNFRAEVLLYESPELVIEQADEDLSSFESIYHLMDDVLRHGYYGGVRLIKAAIKRFGDYCREQGIELPRSNFTIRYHTNIPRLVGMAGSSAIVTATYRALTAFYDVSIPRAKLPSWILSAENDELNIGAGLQDRVVQVYEGLVYMDFDRELMERQGNGRYESLPPDLLPPLYLAFDPQRSEGSERSHNRVRALYERGDPEVVRVMGEIAELAGEVRALLQAGNGKEIGPLLDRNYDLRTAIFPISPENSRMVETARGVGASAKFAGSGGAIIGTYADEETYRVLEKELGGIGCSVIRPTVL